MNTEMYLQISQERVETLRREANLILQLKALAPRAIKKVKSLVQFERRNASA